MKNNPDPLQSNLFKKWLEGVSKTFTIRSIEIQSVDYCVRSGKTEILFIKFKAELVDGSGNVLPRIFFLRGSSVAMLVILVCGGVEYAVLVSQVRPAIGGASYPELPAGIVEKEGVHSAALRELYEETGISVLPNELIDLCEKFYGGAWGGVYPSPGACDEIIHLFLCKKQVSQEVVDTLENKHTGNADENEQITIKLVKLCDLCISTPDPKTHSAFVMYQGLKNKGVLL